MTMHSVPYLSLLSLWFGRVLGCFPLQLRPQPNPSVLSSLVPSFFILQSLGARYLHHGLRPLALGSHSTTPSSPRNITLPTHLTCSSVPLEKEGSKRCCRQLLSSASPMPWGGYVPSDLPQSTLVVHREVAEAPPLPCTTYLVGIITQCSVALAYRWQCTYHLAR